MTKRLLINWVYYLPAGHVVEAIQHAHGYHAANPVVRDRTRPGDGRSGGAARLTSSIAG